METVLLEGAPDASIGTSKTKTSAVQIMHLEMSNDILDDLLECIRKGKAPQVLFGKTPLIKYDGKSHELQSKPEKVRYELYKENEENDEKSWEFSGLINHSLSIQHAAEASAGTERALEALRNTMASIEQDREARKAAVVNTPESRPVKGGMSKAQSRATHLKPLLSGSGRSASGSPSLGSSTPAHLRAPPTSAGLEMPFETAIRKTVVHLLAVQPRPFLRIRKIVGTNPRKVLEKVGKLTNRGDEEWELSDRSYRDLDVWKFNYNEEDRQAAIQNAIRAFDRMRLPKSDPLWEKLLPAEERGTGKILSRLALKDPAKDQAKGSTPALKASSFDKKTGLPKRKEVKPQKPEKAAKPEKPERTEKEKAEKEGVTMPRKAKAGANPKSQAMKSTAESSTPKVEPRKGKEPGQKRLADDRSPAGKQPRPSAAAKGLLNKPNNRSPLGVSPPVNASDFEDNHPVHKKLSSATSPRAGTKRKAEDTDGRLATSNKRPHIDSQSSTSTSSEDRPIKAHKPVAGKSLPASQSKTNGVNGHATTNGHISPGDSDSSNSSSSAPLTLSWRQSLAMARKFQDYYQKYKKLYLELSNSEEPPSEEQREDLLKMHKVLEKMKKDINNGAL